MNAKSAQNTMTITPADLAALADKLCASDHVGLSKPAILNMMAATMLGPKHDWSRIKGAETPLASQRATALTSKAPVAASGIPGDFDYVLKEVEAEGETKVTVKFPHHDILIQTEDDQTVWIERNDGKLKVHVYNDTSDGPCSIRSLPGHRIVMDAEAYDECLYEEFSTCPSSDAKPSKSIR